MELHLMAMGHHFNFTCHVVSDSVTGHPTQVNTPCLNPSQTGWYLIHLPQRDGRLSQPRYLVMYQNGLPAHPRTNPTAHDRESN